MGDIYEEALKKHYEWGGKLEINARCPLSDRIDMSLAYTPGVARPCLEIKDCPEKSFDLTMRHNLVAVITDGTAVLGLGNIGPLAGMPVMEGKCALFKRFAGIDAFPICINSTDVDEIVRTVYLISGSFGGINLEDISAPRCFEVEEKLREICDIPVFHDDQHGTAIVAAAALINALKVVGKKLGSVKIVINGCGAAGCAITAHLLSLGAKNVTVCDKNGAVCPGDFPDSPIREKLARATNPSGKRETLKEALCNADVFIGVSAPNLLKKEDIAKMNSRAIVFPMANPTPEIMPDEAFEGGAEIVGTGRSDYKNQINNVLVFPGIFRGALDCRAPKITEEMYVAASYAIASLIPDSELSKDNIIPQALDSRVSDAVARAVIKVARECGIAKK